MLIELLGHGGMSQYYRQDGQPLGLRHQDTMNATVLQSVTVMQQTNQTILTLAVRLKLAFCTTCAFRVLVLAQGPSFVRLRRALSGRRGGSQDKRSATLTSEGVETIQRKCSTSTEENEVVWMARPLQVSLANQEGNAT